MIPHVVLNVCEDLIRLIILTIGMPIFFTKVLYYAIRYVILSNIVSELSSIFILFLFLPKNFNIKKKDFKLNKNNIIDTFRISIPSTGSRIIGSIGYFLEPILLTDILLYIGYSNTYIVNEYGIINGYVMPIVLLPSFFTLAISNALLPIISKSYIKRDYKYTSHKIKQAIFYSLLIGIPFTILIMIFPKYLLNFLYHTNEGITYIRILAPICILYYIQSPLISSLQAMNKANDALYGTLIGMIIRTLSLIIFSLLHIGLYGLIIASSLNIIYVTVHHLIKVKKYLH